MHESSSHPATAKKKFQNQPQGQIIVAIGNTNVTIIEVLKLHGYVDEKGNKPFAKWFEGLNAIAAAKITIALTRIEHRNHSNVKGVGGGVREYKIDFSPGYRIYFGRAGDRLLILIGGGTKKRQDNDIASAQACWADCKRRKQHAPYP